MMNNKIIFDYLEELIKNPESELNYHQDYELVIAVMLSAQSTDKRVNMVTKVLFEKYPTLNDLSNADIIDIEEIIRSVGTYHRKAQNVIDISKKILEIGGKVPNDRDFLESLNGVGRKTTNVVLSMLFNEPTIAVDTHIIRVSKRLGIANENDDVRTIEDKLMNIIPKDNVIKIHHQLLLFGRYYCKAKRPECNNCQLKNICREKKKNL